jgi:hypothetical protein
MPHVSQVFYCNDCPDGGGYILARINIEINRHVDIVCPKCGRKHPRTIKNGLIYEWADIGNNRDYKNPEEIHLPRSAWHKENPTSKIAMHARDGIPVKAENDFLKELWFELYGEKTNS